MNKYPCIMVVDDEQTIRTLLKRILESEGYEVILAADGNSALTMLEKREPDLVILDINMPGLNGFQVLERIRQHSNVPVIMLTGIGEATALGNALSLGADDFVKKPFNVRELLARIKTKLRRSQAE